MRSRRPSRRTGLICLAAVSTALGWGISQLGHPSLGPFRRLQQQPSSTGPIRVHFLGTTSLLFRDDSTAILSDGFVSRPGMFRVGLYWIAPDRERIANTLVRLGVDSIAAVFAGHSHYDHAMDAPVFAERTGALLLGSESTANIARGLGRPQREPRVVRDGETIEFGKFALTFITSAHSPGDRAPGVIRTPLVPPARYKAWKTDTTYSVLIRHEERTILVHGSAGFKRGALRGRHADVIYLGIAGLGEQTDADVDDYWNEVVRATGARRIILVHWDDFFRSLDHPLRPMAYVADDFTAGMQHIVRRAAADGVQVMLPILLEATDPFAELP